MCNQKANVFDLIEFYLLFGKVQCFQDVVLALYFQEVYVGRQCCYIKLSLYSVCIYLLLMECLFKLIVDNYDGVVFQCMFEVQVQCIMGWVWEQNGIVYFLSWYFKGNCVVGLCFCFVFQVDVVDGILYFF